MVSIADAVAIRHNAIGDLTICCRWNQQKQRSQNWCQ